MLRRGLGGTGSLGCTGVELLLGAGGAVPVLRTARLDAEAAVDPALAWSLAVVER